MKRKPRLCAVITGDTAAIDTVSPHVDLFEVRIDLIGSGWREVARRLGKPWIATNRCADEGGKWRGTEPERMKELLSALDAGAAIIDLELSTDNLTAAADAVKKKGKQCLLSFHSLVGTPQIDTLRDIVQSQRAAGADICKVVTTAQTFTDNLTLLQLIKDHTDIRIVAFAMGDLGLVSRILCPLTGGDFTYAAVTEGNASAPGQLTVNEFRNVYGML